MNNLIKTSIVLFGICFASNAIAHSWYPLRCCSDNDCGKITKMIVLPNGDMDITIHVITSSREFDIQAIFPSDFLMEKSEDGDNHACIIEYNNTPKCLFVGAGY